tara:strand:- start:285 stop:710 length:426 start_codon:yes stop_codon:yes gene_type:complete
MRIGEGEHQSHWDDRWSKIPDSAAKDPGWAHHGMAVTENGNILTCHSGDPTMMLLDSAGNVIKSWPVDLADAHGITVVPENGEELLWIADNGRKRSGDLGYEYPEGGAKGQVLKMDFVGNVLMPLERPELPVYEEGMYSPT